MIIPYNFTYWFILGCVMLWFVLQSIRIVYFVYKQSSLPKMQCTKKIRLFDTTSTITFNFPGGHFYVHTDINDLTKNYFRFVHSHSKIELKVVDKDGRSELEILDSLGVVKDPEFYLTQILTAAEMHGTVESVRKLVVKNEIGYPEVFLWIFNVHIKYVLKYCRVKIIEDFYKYSKGKTT